MDVVNLVNCSLNLLIALSQCCSQFNAVNAVLQWSKLWIILCWYVITLYRSNLANVGLILLLFTVTLIFGLSKVIIFEALINSYLLSIKNCGNWKIVDKLTFVYKRPELLDWVSKVWNSSNWIGPDQQNLIELAQLVFLHVLK